MAEGIRGLIVSAPGTGQGKTTLMLGLVRALTARGLTIGTLKVGPDFIDPEFHRAAGGGVSFNLDGWGMRPETRAGLIAAASYLDSKMREIRTGARSANLDRIAVLAALTMAHELLGIKQRESNEAAQLAHHLQALNAKLERVFPSSLQ